MGHDISGYLKADTEQSNEIAYLRRGAGNPLARTIYAALRHPEFDAGCSGGGYEATFTNEYLRDALRSTSTPANRFPAPPHPATLRTR